MHAEYFEATIQLRNPTQEVINCVANAIEKKEGVHIAKTERQKNGIDLYISSQRYARSLGKLLKQSFPQGELKVTRKLFSQDKQKSKLLYRGTVLFRMPEPEKEVKGKKPKKEKF